MTVRVPRLSVVVEWDNARYYEIQRATIMLRRLLAQLGELTLSAEILLVFDARAIDEGRVKEVIADLAPHTPADVEIAAVPTHGLRYYQLKNEGARRSRGDILFLDSRPWVPGSYWRLYRNVSTAARRIRTGRGIVDLSSAGAATALVIATSYDVISFVAELMTWTGPRVVHRLYAF
jgi:hypothetical protein